MQLATGMGKAANAKHIQDLSVALASIRFASRMRKRSPLAPPVLKVKFEYDLKLFTADLEKSFLAQLATHAGLPAPEMLHVVSRTAGSVILEVEVRAPSAAVATAALAKVEGTPLDELTTVLGYPVLSCSVGPRATPTAAKGTPGYSALAAVSGGSPMPERSTPTPA